MIRRWYLSAVSGITLQAVTWAVIGLLRGLLAGAGAALPQSTSLQLSVVLIGLPIFGLHWRWVQREAGAAELTLRNEARPVYVHVMLLAFVVPWLFSAFWLIEAGLQRLPNTTSASLFPDATAGESVVALLVLTGTGSCAWKIRLAVKVQLVLIIPTSLLLVVGMHLSPPAFSVRD